MKVIPLGTVSGKPTLNRNVSAMAVVREAEWLLFDCGEGTQIQAMRAGLTTSRLSAIFITHLHGDHFNGLAGLLSTMGLDRRERELSLIGPPGIREYIDSLARLKILFVNYPLDIREFAPGAFTAAGNEAKQETDLETLTAYKGRGFTVSCLPLDHRVFAIGYRVQENERPGRFDVTRARQLGIPEGPMFGRLQSGQTITLADGQTIRPSDVLGASRKGRSVAYCTDTRPCAMARELARDVDLLIHEATFTEALVDQAAEYGHSTAAQAAEAARRSGSRKLMITHFSPRFADPSQLLDEATAIFPETQIAEELKEVEV